LKVLCELEKKDCYPLDGLIDIVKPFGLYEVEAFIYERIGAIKEAISCKFKLIESRFSQQAGKITAVLEDISLLCQRNSFEKPNQTWVIFARKVQELLIN
jgi:uncharacterized protein YktB (UPF0637 family)